MLESTLKLTRLILAESGTYNDMFLRPYRSHMDHETMHRFNEYTDRGMNMTPGECAGLAGDILRPQASPSLFNERPLVVAIQNGWGEKRMRFLLEFEISNGVLGTTRWVYSGMTNYVGYTRAAMGNQALVDPKMRFTINTTAYFTTTRVNTPTGSKDIWSIRDPAHLITPLLGEGPGSNIDTLKTTIRPYDVVGKMMTAQVSAPDMTEFDTRNNMLTGVKKSNRRNTLPSQFISKIMTELRSANQDPENLENETLNVLGGVRSLLGDPKTVDDPFLNLLKNKTFYESNNYFTFQELTAMFPNADAETRIAPPAPKDLRVHQRGATDNWSATTNEAVVATLLVQGVPAIMMEHILTIIKFTATNKTFDRSFVVIPDEKSFRSFNNALTKEMMWKYVEAFMFRLRTELLADISNNNMFDVELTMQCEIMGDTFITIALNSGTPVEFAIPSFCDSLLAPVIDNGDRALSLIAQDFSNLSSQLEMKAAYDTGGTMLGGMHPTRTLPRPGDLMLSPGIDKSSRGVNNNDTPEFLI